MHVQRMFEETVADINVAIATKQQLTFDSFLDETDHFCWLAIEQGDVVPSLFIRTIDSALADMLPSCKGKYVQAYNSSVAYHHVLTPFLDDYDKF